MRQSIAAAKPQVIEAYLKAMVEAIATTVDPADRESVTRVIASNLRSTNPADADESYQSVVIPSSACRLQAWTA